MLLRNKFQSSKLLLKIIFWIPLCEMHVLILLLIVEIITEYGVMPLVLLYKIIRVVKFAWKGESTRVKKGGQYTCEYNVVVKTFFCCLGFLL